MVAHSQATTTPSPTTQLFDWHRQWYPLMVVEDMDPEVPHATQLLGMDLVLWRDKAGTWRYTLGDRWGFKGSDFWLSI